MVTIESCTNSDTAFWLGTVLVVSPARGSGARH